MPPTIHAKLPLDCKTAVLPPLTTHNFIEQRSEEMKPFDEIKQLKDMPLFRNMDDKEFSDAVSGLKLFTKQYAKNAVILHAGDTTSYMGIVVSGSIRIEHSDLLGNRTIFGLVAAGNVFVGSYGLFRTIPLLVDVTARENCVVSFIQISQFIAEPVHAFSGWESKLMVNLLKLMCQKNLQFSQRNLHTSPKTARTRILSYLESVSLQTKSNEFDIPFDRQHLADYLNLDRSALSKELGKMRDEGLIQFRKNHFCILERTA